jgi:hypothetical protein
LQRTIVLFKIVEKRDKSIDVAKLHLSVTAYGAFV